MPGDVYVVVEHQSGALHPVAAEALSAGRELAKRVGGEVAAIVVGSGVGDLAAGVARRGVDRVHVADSQVLATYTPGGYTAAVTAALAGRDVAYVVFGHTYQSVDCMARVASELGAAVVSEALSFESGDDGLVFLRPILEGKMQARVRVGGDGPVILSVQSAAFDAAEETTDEAAPRIVVDGPGEEARDREILGVEDVTGDAVDLSAADLIVAVGRGIGDPDKMGVIEDLAQALGAEVGASRPVIDNGWLARDRQIGSSGQTVAPKLYVALGISGAIQHLVGMKGAGCTVAINKDAGAPIFTVSDYGIVGDLFELVPALTEAVREARG